MDTDEIMKAMMHDKKFKEGQMIVHRADGDRKVEINETCQRNVLKEIVEAIETGGVTG